MYDEIPCKYKFMLDKIIKCLLESIWKNLNNKPLLESKLLLINNYVLEIFSHSENQRNNNTNKKLLNFKTLDDRTKIPELEKNVNLSKFSNIILNINKKEKDSNTQRIKISPYKDKNTNIKLKKLLKNEKDKSSLKELFYLKKLSFVEKKLNFYESKINKKNDTKDNNNIVRNNSSLFIGKEKNMNDIIKHFFTNRLNELTIINNSCKMKKINLFKNESVPNYSKRMRIPIIQNKFDDKNNIKIQILNEAKLSKYFDDDEKFIDIIKSKNNFIKPKLNRTKSSI